MEGLFSIPAGSYHATCNRRLWSQFFRSHLDKSYLRCPCANLASSATPARLGRSRLSWLLSTSPRWRSQTVQSNTNRSKCSWEGNCVSIDCLHHFTAYLWWYVLSWLEAIRILHLLSAILCLQCPLCKWQEGMTDLWYHCPRLVRRARPQFEIKRDEIQLGRVWCPSGGLGQTRGNLPRPGSCCLVFRAVVQSELPPVPLGSVAGLKFSHVQRPQAQRWLKKAEDLLTT